MTLVRFKNNGIERPFNNLMDGFFAPMPSLFGNDLMSGKSQVPVNIKETALAYVLDVVAPGLNKEDFKIDLERNMLTVAFETSQENKQTDEKMIRTEYRNQSFKRSFTLDEKIDTNAISAQYVNGVLSLNLPKKAEVKEETKKITIQ